MRIEAVDVIDDVLSQSTGTFAAMTGSALPDSGEQLVSHVIGLSRRYDDSWIAVDGPLDGLLDCGASLETLVKVLHSRRPDAQSSGRCDVDSPYMKDAMEFQETPYIVVDTTSPQYPSRLRSVNDRPLLLYVKGQLPPTDAKALAIVGSRKASSEGLKAAFNIAAVVAASGHPVVSGLAAGTDTAAHEGALSVGGVTVAVMGTGIDLVYPRDNAHLAQRIAETGAVVSQFAPGQRPSKTTFPARNAVIAGLAEASLLIELEERSGTRIEADRTIQQGKPVWLWGPIMRRAQWAHQFAKQAGVSFVDSADEIVDALSD